MILVTGATGTIGREVVAQLVNAGERVRAMTRDPGRADFDSRVEVVQADFNDPRSLRRAIESADRIFSLAIGPDIPRNEAMLSSFAKRAGVRHLVKLSVLGAGAQNGPSVLGWHTDGEHVIEDSGVGWTFVRPGVFMSNAQFWRKHIKRHGKIFSNFASGKIACVHPKDVAAVAVRALSTQGHEGKIYSITGPEALTTAQRASTLSRLLGRQIHVEAVEDKAAKRYMIEAGMPDYLIEALLPFAPVIRDGGAATVLTTVKDVTGMEPHTFSEWAEENIALFR
jgi:uncharacterized protein YbjT (DUF2867 family)